MNSAPTLLSLKMNSIPQTLKDSYLILHKMYFYLELPQTRISLAVKEAILSFSNNITPFLFHHSS
jgi:hypothetical protein